MIFRHGYFERVPFGALGLERLGAGFGELVIFAGRTAGGFLQIGADQLFILHPAHQG